MEHIYNEIKKVHQFSYYFTEQAVLRQIYYR